MCIFVRKLNFLVNFATLELSYVASSRKRRILLLQISGFEFFSEGIFDDRSLVDRLEQNPREILPLLLQLNFKFCQRDIPAVINAIIDYFIGDRPVDRKSERQLASVSTIFHCSRTTRDL